MASKSMTHWPALVATCLCDWNPDRQSLAMLAVTEVVVPTQPVWKNL